MANASVTDRKLLFVDDDPAVLEALCPYFRTRGNTVLTATGVKGALALLAEETFDAAVLGCTHYVFLRRRISSALRCPVFDGNLGTADHLAAVLNICSKNPQKRAKIAPIFTGEAKKKNKSVFFRYI